MINNYQQQQPFVVASEKTRNEVMRNTFLLLALSMIPTAIGAIFGMNMSFMFLASSPILGSIIMIAGMYFLMFMVQKNSRSFAGVIWMMVFTLFMGVLLGPLLTFALRIPNGGQLIMVAAAMTSAVFFVMTVAAHMIKREMPMLNSFLMIGMVVLLIGMVASIFIHTAMMQLVICGGFVVFSSLMILWQVNEIVRGGETNYISATLTIYVSLYNLFTSLLRILIALSGNDR